jgi:hypothetical protein
MVNVNPTPAIVIRWRMPPARADFAFWNRDRPQASTWNLTNLMIPWCLMRFTLALLAALPVVAQDRQQILDAMKKSARFFADKVSTEGGYHFNYAEDLSYGRSEHGEGPTQVETQREGTPRVAMAYLEAHAATGDRQFLEAAQRAGHALVRGQLCSGGWDYIIEFDPAKRRQYPYRSEWDCSKADLPKRPPTTLDDNVSQACLRVLMRVDRALGFSDPKIHEAALFGLDKLASVQYPNGAWPQRFTAPPDASKFPVRKASYPESWSRKWPGEGYYAHYTFNDNSIADCIDTMLEAARIYKDRRYRDSAERGGGFILLAQMPAPQPAWAQQYDLDMHPAWARVFEPPSVTGGESQGIMKMLLVLYRETGERKYLDAVRPALEYLEASILPPQANPSEVRRRAKDPALARFYELRTNKPLYITKGMMLQTRGLGSLRPDGYELSYSDESVITHYGVVTSGAGLAEIRREYDRLAAAKPTARPDALHGLSPWTGGGAPLVRKPSPDRLRQIVSSLDARGAWTQPGQIGKADRVVSVFANRAMVLTINGKPIPIKENDRIELYQGVQPPLERIIRSETFAANLEALAAAVAN